MARVMLEWRRMSLLVLLRQSQLTRPLDEPINGLTLSPPKLRRARHQLRR